MVGKDLIINTKTKGDSKYTAHESVKEKSGENDKPFLQVSQIKAINWMSFFPKFSFLHLCSKTINHHVCNIRT